MTTWPIVHIGAWILGSMLRHGPILGAAIAASPMLTLAGIGLYIEYYTDWLY